MKVNRQLSNRLDARCCWRTLIGYSVGVCHEACGFCDNALPSGLAHITNYIKALSRTRTVFSSQDHHLLLQSPGWTQFYLARQPSAHIGSKRQRKFLFIIYTLEMVLNSLQVGHPVFFFLTQWVEIWETLAMESFAKCAAKWLCVEDWNQHLAFCHWLAMSWKLKSFSKKRKPEESVAETFTMGQLLNEK